MFFRPAAGLEPRRMRLIGTGRPMSGKGITRAFLIGLGLAVVLAAGQAWGGSAPPRPFSALELDKFIVDWPRFVGWARERGEDFDRPTSQDEVFEELFSRQASKYILEMGWRPERFGYLLNRVTTALAGMKMEDQAEAVARVVEAERIEIEHNPDLSEGEKRSRLDQLERTVAEMEAYRLRLKEMNPREVELVREHRERLMKAISSAFKGP